MLIDDLLFVECGGELVPFIFGEDGRLDALSRRRYEVQNNYDRLIAQYEHELARIRADLARNPNDHTHLQMENIYKSRINDARAKMARQVQEIRDEEHAHSARLRDYYERNPMSDDAASGIRGHSHRNTMMFGFGRATA